jgi:photosystem II stability/assembly factor-like uncharacterized protein
MKSRRSISAAAAFLLLSIVACTSFTAATPTASPLATLPPSAVPSVTMPVVATATAEAPTSTAEAATPTVEIPTAWPTSAPQKAAPAQLPVGSPIQLDEIHMQSPTGGWGISAGMVLVTADGGKTWREVTPAATGVDKVYGAFLDQQTAWVIFSHGNQIDQPLTVYATTDGGSTWSTNSGEPLTTTVIGDATWAQFAVLDAENIWMMVRGVYVGAGTHYNHELFRSTDGGQTWTSLYSETSDDYTGMVFADSHFGLRTLQTTGFYGPGAPGYDVTTDGGATWQGRELPAPPDAPDLFNQYPYCESYQPALLSATSIHILMGCFDYYNPPQQFTSYLYSSQDGGTTWTTVHLPKDVRGSQDTLIYLDATNALLIGRGIYKSPDGGQTWTSIQKVTWDGKFSFVNPQQGWGVVYGNGLTALVDTTDGGKTWKEIKPVTGN